MPVLNICVVDICRKVETRDDVRKCTREEKYTRLCAVVYST